MQDDRPTPGIAEALAPGLRRVLADNPSPMTYWGTNTYLLGTRNIAVIDPGPDDAAHLAAILGALETGQRVSHVLVTHSHVDHSPLAHKLARETGAKVHGFGPSGSGRSAIMTRLAAAGLEDAVEGVEAGFAPDIALDDSAVIEGDEWTLEALWTPGHLGNHLSFAMGDTVFCGDLVMGWASSLVAPPDGDLTDFMASCRRLRARGAKVFHSGHGAPIEDPMARLDWLIAHREGRAASILEALRDGPADAQTLARRIYTDTPAALLGAAARNVLAHLIDLHGRNRVAPKGALTGSARFALM
ncbi:metallo-beta-lactamase [Roseovarius atlanticus]|uniref:Metallo-beta-lactamase n=1 Tax=Roseovarius atlanticus TaxID=1641875 RepID=A0A0T5P020_9RHOB|nr:MBL fold metallo-hydrolase [Roseovarius atlanticus]KRS14468.1 metallo-beta-lactamase [Roseovarius atlanticus]